VTPPLDELTARAAVLVAPKRIELRSFRVPQPVEGAVIRIEASGVCGTDVEQFQGVMQEDAWRTPMPAVGGHEPVGRIVAIDHASAKRWGVAVGDRVTARPVWGCGTCEHCLVWQPELCQTRGGTYGFTHVDKAPHLWGSFAEYQYLHPLSVVARVSDDLSAGVATLVNPVACGLSWGWRVPETGPGDTVVILGAGQRGICSAAAARLAGAKKVVMTGLRRDKFKLDEALRIGVDDVVIADADIDVCTALVEVAGGGADVVVDTTPFYLDALHVATEIANPRARIVLAGIKGDRAATNVRQDRITLKELCVTGVSAPRARDFKAAVTLLEREVAMFEPLHTRSYALDDLEYALAAAAGTLAGEEAIHVAIEPALAPRHRTVEPSGLA
jgi:threonine dehydrogenase-like Zn-dependent dehydrogenase